jgi:F-type H+-transporting ATPase subunit alpha
MIKPEEITSIIKKKIDGFVSDVEMSQVGTVLQVGDGIARIYGLTGAVSGELLEFPNDVYGFVLNLEYDNVGCVLMGRDRYVKEGDRVKRTGRIIDIAVGNSLMGRVINPLGFPLDGKGEIKSEEFRPVEVIAPGVAERQPVKQPLQTGLKAIDALVPIGRGQRELIIGDRQTGKTAIAIDTIINQKNNPKDKGVICIYVAIGQKQSGVAQVIKTLEKYGAMDYSIIVSANASEPASLLYLAPYAACSVGEYFMWQGKDVLIVYDDLTKHASAYRQMSLLLRRPPGREAYPGDVFYLHSRLLERACKLNDKNGAGSLTALPIIETQANDVSAYIPTNVISITDGQIYLESNLFYADVKPAINVGLSVSRVGGLAQVEAMRKVAGNLRLDLAQYNELAAFAQFAADLDKSSQRQIARGKRMVEFLKQSQHAPMTVEEQVIVLFAGTHGFADDLPVEKIKSFERGLLDFVKTKHPALLKELSIKIDITDTLLQKMVRIITEFKERFSKTEKE